MSEGQPKAVAIVWGRLATVSAAVLATVTGVVLSFLLTSALERLAVVESQHREMALKLREAHLHIAAHEREAEYWKGQIGKNTDGITRLSTDSGARPNAFTNQDGDALERRIDAVERCCDAQRAKIDGCMRNNHTHGADGVPLYLTPDGLSPAGKR